MTSHAEAALYPDNEGSLQLYATFCDAIKSYENAHSENLGNPEFPRKSYKMLVEENARAAFDEGAGEDACPFKYGCCRRWWIAAYYEQEREP